MKIIVMSDSHGKCGNLIDIGLSHRNADAFIFLGDGWRDFEDFSLYFNDKLCISVKGNCDLGCSADNEKIIFLGDYLDPYEYEGITRKEAINNFEEIIAYKIISAISPLFIKLALASSVSI